MSQSNRITLRSSIFVTVCIFILSALMLALGEYGYLPKSLSIFLLIYCLAALMVFTWIVICEDMDNYLHDRGVI